MNKNKLSLILIGLCLLALGSCSDDKDEPNVNPEVPHWTNKMTARLDSISLGDGAEKPFYQNIYDENGRLMGYEKNGYWKYRDTLQIHYDTNGFPDTVKVKKWLNDSYWGLSRETQTRQYGFQLWEWLFAGVGLLSKERHDARIPPALF